MARTKDQIFNDILVILAQEGDREALDKLAKRWWPCHYTYAGRLLGNRDGAADAVQEAWSQILKGLRKLIMMYRVFPPGPIPLYPGVVTT